MMSKPLWKRSRCVVAVLLLSAGAVGIGWWLQRPAVVVPPLPTIPDDEVRRAVQHARRRVLDAPRDAQAWGHLAMVLLAHQLYDEADLCFVEAVRLDPGAASWPYGRARIALKRHPDNAVAFLRQTLATVDRSRPQYQSAARLQLAEMCLERGQLQEAETLFQEERHYQADAPRLALGLGMISLSRGETRHAEDFLNRAKLSPLARKRATIQLAILARAAGNLEAAAKYEGESTVLPDDPPWPDPFREEIESLRVGHYASVQQQSQLEQQHRFAEAADLYLQEAQDKPTAHAYARAGFNLARAGNHEQARKYLRQAVHLDPNSAQAYYLFAFTLFVWAESEWKRSPTSPQVREWFRESIEQARRTVKLQPSLAMAYLFWGRALNYLGEPAEAVAPLRQGIDCAPENFPLQLALGEVLLKIGEYAEGKIHLKNAQKLKPNDPRPRQALKRLPHPTH